MVRNVKSLKRKKEKHSKAESRELGGKNCNVVFKSTAFIVNSFPSLAFANRGLWIRCPSFQLRSASLHSPFCHESHVWAGLNSHWLECPAEEKKNYVDYDEDEDDAPLYQTTQTSNINYELINWLSKPVISTTEYREPHPERSPHWRLYLKVRELTIQISLANQSKSLLSPSHMRYLLQNDQAPHSQTTTSENQA